MDSVSMDSVTEMPNKILALTNNKIITEINFHNAKALWNLILTFNNSNIEEIKKKINNYDIDVFFYKTSDGKTILMFLTFLKCCLNRKTCFFVPFNHLLISIIKKLKTDTIKLEELLNARDVYGKTFLHYAILNDEFDDISYSKNFKEIKDIDKEAEEKNKTLSKSKICSLFEILYALEINKYLDFSILDNSNNNMLMFFLQKERFLEFTYYLLQIFIDNCDNINAKNNDGNTALHLAILNKPSIQFIQKICNHMSIDLNNQDKNGNTALHLAIKNDLKLPLIEEIINPHLNYTIADNSGNTVLEVALAKKNIAVAQCILNDPLFNNYNYIKLSIKNILTKPNVKKLIQNIEDDFIEREDNLSSEEEEEEDFDNEKELFKKFRRKYNGIITKDLQYGGRYKKSKKQKRSKKTRKSRRRK